MEKSIKKLTEAFLIEKKLGSWHITNDMIIEFGEYIRTETKKDIADRTLKQAKSNVQDLFKEMRKIFVDMINELRRMK